MRCVTTFKSKLLPVFRHNATISRSFYRNHRLETYNTLPVYFKPQFPRTELSNQKLGILSRNIRNHRQCAAVTSIKLFSTKKSDRDPPKYVYSFLYT